jgi:hypothetical protein
MRRGGWSGSSWQGGGQARVRVDTADNLFPAEIAVRDGLLMLDALLAVQKDLREIGEERGVSDRDAVGRYEFKETAYDAIDVASSGELAREGFEVAGNAVELLDLEFFAGVEETERRMRGMAKHAALTAIGERKLAERGFVGCDSGTG